LGGEQIMTLLRDVLPYSLVEV